MKTKTLRLILLLAIAVAIHIGLWMAYVDNPSVAEWIIGILAAILATLAAYAAGHVGKIKFRPTLRMLAQCRHVPIDLLVGTWDLLIVTNRKIFRRRGANGQLEAVPFTFGSQSARDAARRTLASSYCTLTPNSIVLGIVSEQDLLIYHQARHREPPQIILNLGAK